jgi:hypothetical protein
VKFHQWETMLVADGCELGVTNGHYHTWLCREILQFYLIIPNVVGYLISSQVTYMLSDALKEQLTFRNLV